MGVAEPGSLKLRYDHLTGGESERNVYYMARRHLGLSFAEWDALAWHEQQTYLEGMLAEFSDPDPVSSADEIDAAEIFPTS